MFVADCGGWLDSFPNLRHEGAREQRSLYRYQFRNIHILALAHVYSVDEGFGLQLPDLGSPIDEITHKPGTTPSRYTLESAYRQARRASWLFPVDHGVEFFPGAFHAIPAQVIEKSLLLACELATSSDDVRQLLTILYDSITYHSRSAFPQSFIMCWAVVEKCLAIMYDDFVSRTYTGSRAKKLKDGRSFTISVVIEILENAGLVQKDDYETIESARKARNNFMHRLAPIEERLTADLLFVSQRLLASAIGFEPRFGLMRQGLG